MHLGSVNLYNKVFAQGATSITDRIKQYDCSSDPRKMCALVTTKCKVYKVPVRLKKIPQSRIHKAGLHY